MSHSTNNGKGKAPFAFLAPLRLPAQAGGGKEYSITIGSNIEAELVEAIEREGKDRRIAVITDDRIRALFGDILAKRLRERGLATEVFDFPAGEKSKNQETVTKRQQELLEKRFGRDTLIVALGGGIAGDVAGFVASTYLRGVPYINVPTTLLAMVDSSIGGKVGIDTPWGKNTIGAFWPPRAVVMDAKYLSRLPAKEMINGLLEAVKTFFTSDADAVPLITKLDPEHPAADEELLLKIISASVRIKSGITGRDPREENERRVLNFGHTIGHAIELLSGYELPHGYAVGYGMLAESKISEMLRILSAEDRAGVFQILGHLGIEPSGMPQFAAQRIIEAAKGDKKTRGGAPYYVLLAGIGSVHQKGGQFAHPVADEIVKKALASL